MQSISRHTSSPTSASNEKIAGALPSTHLGNTIAKVAVLLIDDSPVAVLRPDPTAAFLGIGSSTLSDKLDIDSKYHDPDVPKPIELGGRNRGFLVSELFAYLDLKAAQRSKGKR